MRLSYRVHGVSNVSDFTRRLTVLGSRDATAAGAIIGKAARKSRNHDHREYREFGRVP